MKYIEEINPGDLFSWKDKKYILSSDFKKSKRSNKYMCLSLDDGCTKWIEADTAVDIIDLYYRDAEGNIFLLKEFKDETIENKKLF